MGNRTETTWSLLVGSGPRGRFTPAHERNLHAVTRRFFPGGYSVLVAKGGWYDPRQRKFIREESRQILVVCRSKTRVLRWARALGKKLRQREVITVAMGKGIAVRVADD